MGLEGSGAFRRPGSIVRVLRTERWVRPTERAGSEGSFICRCLGQRKPSNRAALRGPPIGGQDLDGASYRCSAPYTLCLFEAFPSRGNEKIDGTEYCVTYDTDSQSRNVLASPLGEDGHEVAKGCTRVRMIMILDVDVTAEGGIIKLIARKGNPPPFEPACQRQAEPSEPSEPGPQSGPIAIL
jgi:hypothetical protein